MSRPELSAILIVYNGIRFLPDCLRTLTADLGDLEHEIIAVDNGSTDGSVEFLTTEFPAVRVVRNGSNLGFARAVNIGLAEARGEYVYILNQDLRFRRGSTRTLLSRLKCDEQIGLIGPKFVGFDGSLQKSARAFPGMRHVWYKALMLPWIFPSHREIGGWKMQWFDHVHEQAVDQPMGAAMLLPRGVVDRVGLLDERFPIFFNDVDYCRRIGAAGYTLLYYPDAVVEHYVGGTTHLYPVRMVWESHRSMYRYLSKYARWYERPALWATGALLYLGMLPALLSRLLRPRPTEATPSSSSE